MICLSENCLCCVRLRIFVKIQREHISIWLCPHWQVTCVDLYPVNSLMNLSVVFSSSMLYRIHIGTETNKTGQIKNVKMAVMRRHKLLHVLSYSLLTINTSLKMSEQHTHIKQNATYCTFKPRQIDVEHNTLYILICVLINVFR